MKPIPFEVINWNELPVATNPGIAGIASAHIKQYAGLRIRQVDYSPGYLADHWCQKGHIVHCLEGSFTSEMESGEKYELTKGMSYVVTDEVSSHRSSTVTGVTLLIIDGDFLRED
jgi:quercetin dioxygenase-like cupin family protein